MYARTNVRSLFEKSPSKKASFPKEHFVRKEGSFPKDLRFDEACKRAIASRTEPLKRGLFCKKKCLNRGSPKDLVKRALSKQSFEKRAVSERKQNLIRGYESRAMTIIKCDWKLDICNLLQMSNF